MMEGRITMQSTLAGRRLPSFCLSAVLAVLLLVFFFLDRTNAYLPSHNPPWSPTYNVTESLITMQCNSSGYSNVDRAAQFGIVSYDWSNAKEQWAKTIAKPMDCEEKLSEQARMLANIRRKKNRGNSNTNNTHVFVYRNIVKALPWFSTVRTKLIDPAYEGFFLKFSDDAVHYHVSRCAAETPSKCSNFYHDQEQTPAVPTPKEPHPDGFCDSYHGCNCGKGLPCGEYYFDHRNGTMLREWLVKEIILGSLIAADDGNAIVDGLFLDDYWCSDLLCKETRNTVKGCPCDNPFQGPTESDPYSVLDMGLSDRDIWEITLEWNQTMALVEQRLLEHGAYTWWLMEEQENANAMPYVFDLDNNENDGDKSTNHSDEIATGDRESTDSNANNNNHNKRSLLRNINTNKPSRTRSERCIEILEDACSEDSTWQTTPKLFGFSVNKAATTTPTAASQQEQQQHYRNYNHYLPNLDLEWTFFLLVRGPFSWAGWGEWGMTWPFQKEPRHGALPPLPNGVPLPHILTPEGQTDYGVPLGICYQSTSNATSSNSSDGYSRSGVFRREWSNGWMVEIDCNGCNHNHHDARDSYDDDGNDNESLCERFGVKHRITRIVPTKPIEQQIDVEVVVS